MNGAADARENCRTLETVESHPQASRVCSPAALASHRSHRAWKTALTLTVFHSSLERDDYYNAIVRKGGSISTVKSSQFDPNRPLGRS